MQLRLEPTCFRGKGHKMKTPTAYWVADNIKPVTELELIYLFLSVSFWKSNHNTPTILYTSANNFEFYNNLKLWDDVRVFSFESSIDKGNNKFWAAGKLQAMREFETPFAILDLDMFFTDKIQFNADVITAHREDGTGYYFNETDPILKKAGIVPLRREPFALNVSFLYIKNEEFRKKYVDIAVDWMERISAVGQVSGGHMTFCEQKLLYDLVVNENVSFRTLIENETNCTTQSWIPPLDKDVSPFFHLAVRKYWIRKSMYSSNVEKSKVLTRLKKDCPHLLKPLFDFIKSNSLVNTTKSDKYTLKGNFDLLLTGACTLSCKGCTYLDYKDVGCTISRTLRLDDVKYIINKLLKLDIKLETLTLLGGEPTLHPKYIGIVKELYKFKGLVYDKLRIITNGTNLNKDFLDSLDYLDIVRFSIYPNSKEIETSLYNSGLFELIKSKCRVVIRNYTTFSKYGEEQNGLEYSKQLNWDRCWAKDRCRPITVDGIYRCYIAYNSKTNICDYSNREQLIDYINNNTNPLNICEACPMPCKEISLESIDTAKDAMMVDRGVMLINKWNTY